MFSRKSAITAASSCWLVGGIHRSRPTRSSLGLSYVKTTNVLHQETAGLVSRPNNHPHYSLGHLHHQTRTFSATHAVKMQENVAKLYANPELSGKVMGYSIAHSTPLPEYLLNYHKWGCEETKVPEFLISTFQAQMLIFLAKIVGAKNGETLSRQPYIPAIRIILT